MPKVMLADPRLPLLLQRAWTTFAALVLAYAAVLAVGCATGVGMLPPGSHAAIGFALLLGAAVLVLGRALSVRDDRAAWLVLGTGLSAWAAGQLVGALAAPTGEEMPFPSAADVGLLVFYISQYVAFFLLARPGLRGVPRATWLDGAVGILLLGAIGAHWVFTPLLQAGGTASAAAVAIAIPAADIVLLALVVCVIVLHGGRPGLVWWRIGLGVTVTALGDALFALASAHGDAPSSTSGPLAIFFGFGTASLVAAAVRPTRRPRRRALSGWPAPALPGGLFLVVLALLVVDTATGLTPVAMALLTVAIALIGVRAAIAFRENAALADSRRQALTDELTGLPNRRSAYAELDARCAAGGAVTALMIDLDRFKELNDTLGHHAGDDALVAVASRARPGAGRRRDAQPARRRRVRGPVLAPGSGERDGPRCRAPAARRARRAPPPRRPAPAGPGEHRRRRSDRRARRPRGRSCGAPTSRCTTPRPTRNGVEVYASERDGHRRERLAMAAELRRAISDGELVLHLPAQGMPAHGPILGARRSCAGSTPCAGSSGPPSSSRSSSVPGSAGCSRSR